MSFQIALQRLEDLLQRHFPTEPCETGTEGLCASCARHPRLHGRRQGRCKNNWTDELFAHWSDGLNDSERQFDGTFGSFLDLKLCWVKHLVSPPFWMNELSASLQALQSAAPPSQLSNVGSFLSKSWVEDVEFDGLPQVCRNSAGGDVCGHLVQIKRLPFDECWLAPLRLLESESESEKRTVVVTFGEDWLSVGDNKRQFKLGRSIVAAVKVVYLAWPESRLAKEIRAEVQKQTGLVLKDRMDKVWGVRYAEFPNDLRGHIEGVTGGSGGYRWVDKKPT